MTNISKKISELPYAANIRENAVFPTTISEEEETTVKVTTGQVRSVLNFENAFSTIENGLDNTELNDLFYVYTDSSKQFVRGFLKGASGEQKLISPEGEDVIYVTGGGLKELTLTNTPVASIADLRLFEPLSNEHSAQVSSYYTDDLSHGGGKFYFDPADGTTADDGIFTFVTPNGARWKRSLTSNVYNLAMAGVRPGDDATVALNNLVTKIINQYKTNLTSSTIPINFNNGSIEVNPGTYILSAPVRLYTLTPLNALGDVTFDGRSIASGAGIFKISNDGLAKANKPKYLTTGIVLNGAHGTINIVGSKTIPGIAIGNTQANMADCRDHLVNNVSVAYVTSFIDFNGAYDTYLVVVSNFRGYGASLNGIIFSQTSFSNSGERMQFIEMTLGGCDGNGFSVAQPGVMISIHNASFDFITGNVINLSPNVAYAMIDITGGSHAEAFNGYVATSNSATNKITWNGGTILPTSRTRGTLDNYAGRILFNGTLQTFQLRDIHILSSYPSDNDSVYLGKPFTDSPVILSSTGLFTTYGQIPTKYDIVNVNSDFTGEVVGTVMGTSVTTLKKFMKPDETTYWRQGVTPTVVQLDDGTTALQLVPTTTGLTTNFVVLTTVDYIPLIGAKSLLRLWAVCQPLSSTLRLRVEVSFSWYDGNKVFISKTQSGGTSDLYTNSQITTLPSYSADPVVNGKRKLASLANSQFAPPGAVYGKPVWTISGIDQTVNINQLATAYVQ